VCAGGDERGRSSRLRPSGFESIDGARSMLPPSIDKLGIGKRASTKLDVELGSPSVASVDHTHLSSIPAFFSFVTHLESALPASSSRPCSPSGSPPAQAP